MDRARLAILALCALLSTTLDPFGGSLQATTPAVASKPADPEATGTPAPGARNFANDDISSQILARLSMRHTALSENERLALVDTIIRESLAQDLEPGLVVAVIEVESAGYHLAVSHVGAMGLMQLLPSTAEEMAQRMNVEWRGPHSLFDPTVNVKLGTAYLRQLADRYGSVQTALAAYNWGPGRIDRRLRSGASLPSLYIEQVMRAVDRNAMTTVKPS